MFRYYLELALQNLRRNPWLTALTVLAIGVGIGSSMSVYSVLHAMSRNPAPEVTRRLYMPRLDNYGPEVWASYAERLADRSDAGLPRMLSYRDAMALREEGPEVRRSPSLIARVMVADRHGGQVEANVGLVAVDDPFFEMFRLTFLHGRPWSREAGAARERVVVVAETLAQRYFGRADAIGETIRINGESFRIVGVVARWRLYPRFYAPLGAKSSNPLAAFTVEDELYIPFDTYVADYRRRSEAPGARSPNPTPVSPDCPLPMLPRAREGWFTGECAWVPLWVELRTAQEVGAYRAFLQGYAAEQQRMGRFRWDAATRLDNAGERIESGWFVPEEFQVAPLVGFGFLAVCVINASGLMLARFYRRRRELGLRRALGATRGSLLVQCLTEAALIGACGGLLGLVLLRASVAIQDAMFPPEMAGFTLPDMRLVLATLMISVLAAMAAGVLPAWRAVQATSLGQAASLPRRRFGALLIGMQVALTLAVAGNSLYLAWQRVDAMRQPDGVDGRNLFAILSVWSQTPDDLRARQERDLAELRALPGVVSVSESYGIPGAGPSVGLFPLYPSLPRPGSPPGALGWLFFVDEHALETFGLRLLEGRWFEPAEVAHGGVPPFVAVVSPGLARRLFPGESAVGKVAYLTPEAAYTIIGVVGGLYGESPDRAYDQVYLVPLTTYAFLEGGTTSYIVRTQPGRRAEVMRLAERRLADIDPARAFPNAIFGTGNYGAMTYEYQRDRALRGYRNLAITLITVCTLLLVTTGLGIVGLTSYWISQERLLIGVRRALGATRGNILRRVHLDNLSIITLGLVAGAVLATAGSLWLAGIFELPRIHPLALALGAALILLISQLAVFWPARRAASVPPALATRAG